MVAQQNQPVVFVAVTKKKLQAKSIPAQASNA